MAEMRTVGTYLVAPLGQREVMILAATQSTG